MNHLGIDPGTVNIGIAVTDNDGKLVYSTVLNCRELGGIDKVINEILCIVTEHQVSTCAIERFVPYRNVFSSSAEEILMLIGAIWYALKSINIEPIMFRAISWKPALCKYLVKTQGFSNPSTNFDKKYSVAAAQAITGTKVKTNHESDAVCLSYIWKLTSK